MAQISNVMIPCWCVQMNNQQFISPEGIIGAIENIPCRNVHVDEILYWCTPVEDYGIGDALQFRLATGDNAAQPTPDSFLVQRIRDKVALNKNNTWWVYVLTANDFLNSCNTCCGDAAVPMPTFTFRPFIPCQTLCAENNAGDLEGVFGLPTLGAGQQYYPWGTYDNESLPGAPTSYASVAALLVFLNANWTNIGSPNTTFVWTKSGDNLTLFATGGIAGHELCVTVMAIEPSP